MKGIGEKTKLFLRWISENKLTHPMGRTDYHSEHYPFKFNPLPHLHKFVFYKDGYYQLTDLGFEAIGEKPKAADNVVKFQTKESKIKLAKQSLITKKFSTEFYGKNRKSK